MNGVRGTHSIQRQVDPVGRFADAGFVRDDKCSVDNIKVAFLNIDYRDMVFDRQGFQWGKDWSSHRHSLVWVNGYCPKVAPMIMYFWEEQSMLLQTDARRRITLPPIVGIKPGDAIDLEVLDDGRIMLIPVEPVPRHQLWAWTAEAKQSISSSLADSRPSVEITTAEQAQTVASRWADEN